MRGRYRLRFSLYEMVKYGLSYGSNIIGAELTCQA